MDKTRSKVAKLSSCSAPGDLDNQQKSPITELAPNRKVSNSSFNIDNLLQIPNIVHRAAAIDHANNQKAENQSNPSRNWTALSPDTPAITQPMGSIISQQSHANSAGVHEEDCESFKQKSRNPSGESSMEEVSDNSMENNEIINVE